MSNLTDFAEKLEAKGWEIKSSIQARVKVTGTFGASAWSTLFGFLNQQSAFTAGAVLPKDPLSQQAMMLEATRHLGLAYLNGLQRDWFGKGLQDRLRKEDPVQADDMDRVFSGVTDATGEALAVVNNIVLTNSVIVNQISEKFMPEIWTSTNDLLAALRDLAKNLMKLAGDLPKAVNWILWITVGLAGVLVLKLLTSKQGAIGGTVGAFGGTAGFGGSAAPKLPTRIVTAGKEGKPGAVPPVCAP